MKVPWLITGALLFDMPAQGQTKWLSKLKKEARGALKKASGKTETAKSPGATASGAKADGPNLQNPKIGAAKTGVGVGKGGLTTGRSGAFGGLAGCKTGNLGGADETGLNERGAENLGSKMGLGVGRGGAKTGPGGVGYKEPGGFSAGDGGTTGRLTERYGGATSAPDDTSDFQITATAMAAPAFWVAAD